MEGISVPTTKIDGIGDEAFIVAPSPTGDRKLSFRRGPVVLQVEALDEQSTVRFARLFVAAVHRSVEAREVAPR
jgi:hypothetical protein